MSRPRCPRLLASSLLVLGVALPAGAQEVLRVPQDFATIQEAVDAADDGDTVLVSKGTYPENVVVQGKTGLTLQGRGKAIVDGGGIGSAVTVDGCTDVVVQKLTFVNGAPHGLSVVGSPGTLVSRCRADANLEAGVHVLASDDVAIEKCSTTGGEHGLVVDDSDGATIAKNKVSDCADDGIQLSDAEVFTSDEALVSKNVVRRTGDDGIDVNGSGGLVEKNRIFDTEQDGIEADPGAIAKVEGGGGATGVLFEKNKVTRAGEEGLQLEGSGNIARQNKVLHAGRTGIELEGAGGHVVDRNVVLSAVGDGLNTDEDSEGNTITSNKLVKCGDDGVDIESAGNELVENKVVKPVNRGFVLEAGGNTLTGNKASKSGTFGLSDLVGGNTYADNAFDSIEDTGFGPDA